VKICPHCQRPIRDDIWLCPLCGGAVSAVASGAAPYGAGGPMPSVPVHDDSKALASLICGIIGVVLLPFIASIPAIILGHLSLSEIKRSAGRLGGRGMAVAGVVLGYLGVAFLPIILIIAAIAIPNLIRARMAANEASTVGAMRKYSTGLYLYENMCQETIFPTSLSKLGPGKPSCDHLNAVSYEMANDDAVLSGYRFRYMPGAPNASGQILTYTITADPISPTAGVRHFYVDQTTVIRYKSGEPADGDSPALQ
jgi:type IV pilus assembly protein PilA